MFILFSPEIIFFFRFRGSCLLLPQQPLHHVLRRCVDSVCFLGAVETKDFLFTSPVFRYSLSAMCNMLVHEEAGKAGCRAGVSAFHWVVTYFGSPCTSVSVDVCMVLLFILPSLVKNFWLTPTIIFKEHSRRNWEHTRQRRCSRPC